MKKNSRMHLRIDTILKEQVFEKAETYDLSVSQIACRLLQKWVNRETMYDGKIGAVRLPEREEDV